MNYKLFQTIHNPWFLFWTNFSGSYIREGRGMNWFVGRFPFVVVAVPFSSVCLPQDVLSCPGDTTALKASTTASSRPFPAGPWGHWRCCVAALQSVSVRGTRWDCMDLPSSAPSPALWLKFSANSILSYRLTDVTPRKLLPWFINILLKAFNICNWSHFDCTVPGII